MNNKTLPIPDGKSFIFSIFDDTDVSTLGNIRPVYDCLSELGIFTTKSVWPLDSHQQNSNYKGSHSLQNPEYAAYVKELAHRGFEIAFHGAAMESSERKVIVESLDQFSTILGFKPRTYACHAGNKENIYWGEQRFTFTILRQLYLWLNREKSGFYAGHDQSSNYFWADICHESFDYVRTFTFNDINLLNIGKIPYQMAARPCFNNCFFTSFADHVEEFNRLLCEKNQDKLRNEHGVCIITTHFGKGFVKDGVLNPRTKQLLELLVKNNGYFAPVSSVLDHMGNCFGRQLLTPVEMFKLELRWFVDTIMRKLNKLDYEKTELKYLGLQ